MLFPFLVIISLLAGAFALWTKQTKTALGFLIFTIAFFLMIPNLTTGIQSSFLEALALIFFVLGSLIIVWKKQISKIDGEKK